MNENKIIEFMKSEDYIPMKAKELAVIFNVQKLNIEELKQILNKMEQNLQKISLMDYN